MGLAIAALTAATDLNDDDVFEIEQSVVSKKLTKLQLFNLLYPEVAEFISPTTTILPQNGDVIYYDGAGYSPGKTPRWRVIHQNAYTESAVATSSTITFAGGGPTDGIYLKGGDYFEVGDPVRVVFGGDIYYGICTAVTDTLLTIAAPPMPLATPITSVSVGSRDMVKHVRMEFPDVNYNLFTSQDVQKSCRHHWHGPEGFLVAWSASHMNTSATTVLTPYINSIAVQSVGVTMSAGTATTHGPFADCPLATVIKNQNNILDGEFLSIRPTTVGGSADYLVACFTFVVP